MFEYIHTVVILCALEHEQRMGNAASARLAANEQLRRPSLCARARSSVRPAAARESARIWSAFGSPPGSTATAPEFPIPSRAADSMSALVK
jgi:hypothetical protein